MKQKLRKMKKTKFKHMTANATNGELYDPAMKIALSGNKEAAEEYFHALVDYVMEYNPDIINGNREKAIGIVHSNLGYWAGYYSDETRVAVRKMFGSSHPVFGDKFPSPEEALRMGMELGKKWKNEENSRNSGGR